MSAAEEGATGSAQLFSARMVVALVLVGVFTFAAFIVLTTYAPELRSGRDGRAHALSRSAVGYAGLSRLVRDAGLPVLFDRGRGEADQADGVRVVTPEPGGDRATLREALSDTSRGVTLVILPKWQVAADPNHPGWVRRAGFLPNDAVAGLAPADLHVKVLRREGAARPRLLDVEEPGSGDVPADVGVIDGLQTLAPSARLEPLIADEQGRALLVRVGGDAGLYILSDPDLLNTMGLAHPVRARLAIRILDILRGSGPVVFDLAVNGFAGSRSLLKLALEPPFLAATLCALTAAALMGWHAAARFGAVRRSGRALALGKKALADNSAALLRLAKREHRMASPYALLTVQAVAKAVGAPRGLDHAATLDLLDRLSLKAQAPHTASALLAEAASVADPAALVRSARRLHDWRRRMMRETI